MGRGRRHQGLEVRTLSGRKLGGCPIDYPDDPRESWRSVEGMVSSQNLGPWAGHIVFIVMDSQRVGGLVISKDTTG